MDDAGTLSQLALVSCTCFECVLHAALALNKLSYLEILLILSIFVK